MKILLIEDDQNKSKQIIDFFKETFPGSTIELRKSYQSGLKEIFSSAYDLILLDMQLPNFDIMSGEDGYRFRKLAGVDILREVQRKNRLGKFIVLTQFETFGENESYIELNDLKKMVQEQYPNLYIDTIFYSPNQSIWKKQLKEVIKNSQ